MPKTLALRLSPSQARFLWQILDGAMDAGACKEGMTTAEQRMGKALSSKLLDFVMETKNETRRES